MFAFNANDKKEKMITNIGTACSVVSVLLFFVDKMVDCFSKKNVLSDNWVRILEKMGNVAVPLFAIGFIIILIHIIKVALRSRVQSLHTQREIATHFHQQMNHILRNEIVELDGVRCKVANYEKMGERDAAKELYKSEYDRMKENLQSLIDSLSNYLSEYRKDDISACIKLFKSRDENRRNFDDEIVVTVVRSSNTKKERDKVIEESAIRNNTDFHNLCSGRIVFFGSSNLLKLSESGQYESDSESWGGSDSKYVSTIVTPIRYYNNEKNKIKIDIIGFLCIDSIQEIKEWENQNSFELQMMAAYSDILYIYLKDFYSCFKEMKGE